MYQRGTSNDLYRMSTPYSTDSSEILHCSNSKSSLDVSHNMMIRDPTIVHLVKGASEDIRTVRVSRIGAPLLTGLRLVHPPSCTCGTVASWMLVRFDRCGIYSTYLPTQRGGRRLGSFGNKHVCTMTWHRSVLLRDGVLYALPKL